MSWHSVKEREVEHWNRAEQSGVEGMAWHDMVWQIKGHMEKTKHVKEIGARAHTHITQRERESEGEIDRWVERETERNRGK